MSEELNFPNKKNRQHIDGDSGFTMIEVIVSVVLMSLVAVGVLAPLFWSQQTVSQQTRISFGVNVANEVVDAIRYDGSASCFQVSERISDYDGTERTTSSGNVLTVRTEHDASVCGEMDNTGVLDLDVYTEYDGEEISQSRISTRVFVE